MIKYALVCDQGHDFESWFPSSDSYDTQVKRGFVECPACQSRKVSKALMAPAVSTSRKRRAMRTPVEAQAADPATPATPQPVALLDERQQQMRAMIRELHRKLTEHSTDVGESFPAEARRMHEGESPKRTIHGQATLEEARALVEEGIPVMPLPPLPDEKN
jgi:hypothetical protein